MLVKRYGHAEHYSPGQVKTAVERAKLSPRYLPHACAMFCALERFVEWMHDRDRVEQPTERRARCDPYRSVLPRPRTPTEVRSSIEYAEIFQRLRAEAAEINGGNEHFLPSRPSEFDTFHPISNDSATGMKAMF